MFSVAIKSCWASSSPTRQMIRDYDYDGIDDDNGKAYNGSLGKKILNIFDINFSQSHFRNMVQKFVIKYTIKLSLIRRL